MKAKKYYDKIAYSYNELYGEEQLNKWDVAKKLMNFSENDKVLDVGCGTGLITQKIAEKAKIVVGVDISKKMLEKAKKRENITYKLGDATDLTFKNNTFDKVISFTVIQDIKKWDKVLKEIKRVAKKDILITVLKRKKNLKETKKKLSKYFKIKDFVEEEKDFIFLVE